MINNQFSKFKPKKLFMCKTSGLIIPKITSTMVMKDKIPKTVQILLVLETCSCDIIITFCVLN